MGGRPGRGRAPEASYPESKRPLGPERAHLEKIRNETSSWFHPLSCDANEGVREKIVSSHSMSIRSKWNGNDSPESIDICITKPNALLRHNEQELSIPLRAMGYRKTSRNETCSKF